MSLKAFHFVFILASIVTCFGFSYWCLTSTQYSNPLMAYTGIAAGILLVVYFIYFLKKLIHI